MTALFISHIFMLLDDKEGWELIGFKKSNRPNKKLTAILKNGDAIRQIHFGQKGSSTFRDLTEVGGDPTHGDEKKRKAYRARHKGEGDTNRKYSAGWLSYHLLW